LIITAMTMCMLLSMWYH